MGKRTDENKIGKSVEKVEAFDRRERFDTDMAAVPGEPDPEG